MSSKLTKWTLKFLDKNIDKALRKGDWNAYHKLVGLKAWFMFKVEELRK